MFCKNCGAAMPEGASFCGACGAAAAPSRHEEARNQTGLVGFSQRINDPSFAAYKKKSVAWSFIFTGALAVLAAVGFPIYGQISGEMEWPNSLFYGFGLGGMFLGIALLQTIVKGLDKTWDGVVENKDYYTVKRLNSKGRAYYNTYYRLMIRKDSGGIKKHKWRDSPGISGYFKIGDRVRHHKGLMYYEKHDKSGDTQIMCAACMAFLDINKDICPKCKCPLLK